MLTRSQIDKKFETMACERASKSRQPPTPGHAAAEGALNGPHEHTPMCYGDNDDGTYPGECETDEEFGRRLRRERIQHEADPETGGKMARDLAARGLTVGDPLTKVYSQDGPADGNRPCLPPTPEVIQRPFLCDGHARRSDGADGPHSHAAVPQAPMSPGRVPGASQS